MATGTMTKEETIDYLVKKLLSRFTPPEQAEMAADLRRYGAEVLQRFVAVCEAVAYDD